MVERTLLAEYLLEACTVSSLTWVADRQSLPYEGHSLQVGPLQIIYRKAKITPKKVGFFVALWKRNLQGQTSPFELSDPIDFYIIVVSDTNRQGCFVFPKQCLAARQLLTSTKGEGKRGFRLYAPWDQTANRTAIATQQWQRDFFVDLQQERHVLVQQLQRALLSEELTK